MNEFENISEVEVLYYAMKGLCEHIVKTASQDDLALLNNQFFEMNKRRNELLLTDKIGLSRIYKTVPMKQDTLI